MNFLFVVGLLIGAYPVQLVYDGLTGYCRLSASDYIECAILIVSAILMMFDSFS